MNVLLRWKVTRVSFRALLIATLLLTVAWPPAADAARRPVPIWTHKKFRSPPNPTDKHVCYPTRKKSCPDELGGWKMKELIFRHNYGSAKVLRRKAKRIELRVTVRFLVTPSTLVQVRAGKRKLGSFRIDSLGETRHRMSKRAFKDKVDLRLIAPTANVGFGKPAKGFIISRVQLVGIR